MTRRGYREGSTLEERLSNEFQRIRTQTKRSQPAAPPSAVDEEPVEGLELANEKAAEVEAANTLAGLARDSEVMRGRLDVAIDVRSMTESLFCAALIHRMNRTRH